jgi:aspartate/glutamate racemase
MLLGLCIPNIGYNKTMMHFFANHIQVFKIVFCCGKTIHKVDEQEVQMHKLLYATNFDYQQGMFKLSMKSNPITCMVPPIDTNPLTKMWCLNCDSILDTSF